MSKKTFPTYNMVIFILAITLFISLFYMASYFRGREEQIRSEKPIVFCQPSATPNAQQKCYFTTHIHVFTTIKIFGEERALPFENGLLERFHTHFEKNKVHWHTLISADPATKQPLEILTLGEIFDDFGILFDDNGIYGFESGMSNPKTGLPAKLSVSIDGEEIENPRDFVLNPKHMPKEIEVIFK